MILKKYKKQKEMTDEEKAIQRDYEIYCELTGSYDHLTDKQIEERYKKYYLL